MSLIPINIPIYSGTIGALTVNGALTVGGSFSANGRMYVYYNNPSANQNAPASTITTVQFPNQVTSINASGITVSGTGNTTFTNTSGVTQLWQIVGVSGTVNTDSGYVRFATAIYVNGAQVNTSAAVIPAGYPTGNITSVWTLPINNNDYVTIGFNNTSASVAMTITVAKLAITQL